ISTGRVTFEDDTGSFDPVISDGSDIYLTGYSSLFGLQPTDLPATPTAPLRTQSKPRRPASTKRRS
ncbi:MAG: hypothetical protein ACRDJX_00885, partial [Solirubrobacteraceae bacterium]